MFNLYRVRIVFIILRILTGLVFIFSGLIKLYPVEPFEILSVDIGIANWTLAPFVARFIISFEITLGLFIIFNVYIRQVLKISITMLVVFTIYLIYTLIAKGNSENCGCFGTLIKMTPVESIIKNAALLVLCFALLFLIKPFNWRYKIIILIAGILISLAGTYILNPVIIEEPGIVTDRYKFNISSLGEYNYNNKVYDLSKDKKIVCFFSMKCQFCRLAAYKMSVIREKLKSDIPVFYVFFGDTNNLEEFWGESKSYHFPYMIVPPENFFNLSGKTIPAIVFIENDTIVSKERFFSLTQKKVEEFLLPTSVPNEK